VGEAPSREGRVAEPAEVEADDPVPLGEGLDLAVPEPAVADARVEEEGSGALADDVVGELGAVDPRRAQRSFACDASR
jgi:hypothetical protein